MSISSDFLSNYVLCVAAHCANFVFRVAEIKIMTIIVSVIIKFRFYGLSVNSWTVGRLATWQTCLRNRSVQNLGAMQYNREAIQASQVSITNRGLWGVF